MDNKNLGGWAISNNLYVWILNNINKGSKILELGSGSGSHELGKDYEIYCIEHSQNWVNKFNNINYIFAPIKDGWYDTECLKKIPKDYDLLIIDGPPGNIGRLKFLEYKEYFKLDVPIIVDDTNRSDELILCNTLNESLNKGKVFIEDAGKQSIILL